MVYFTAASPSVGLNRINPLKSCKIMSKEPFIASPVQAGLPRFAGADGFHVFS